MITFKVSSQLPLSDGETRLTTEGGQKLVSGLKFAYLESTLKLSVASHILATEGPVLISIAENDAKGAPSPSWLPPAARAAANWRGQSESGSRRRRNFAHARTRRQSSRG